AQAEAELARARQDAARLVERERDLLGEDVAVLGETAFGDARKHLLDDQLDRVRLARLGERLERLELVLEREPITALRLERGRSEREESIEVQSQSFD